MGCVLEGRGHVELDMCALYDKAASNPQVWLLSALGVEAQHCMTGGEMQAKQARCEPACQWPS